MLIIVNKEVGLDSKIKLIFVFYVLGIFVVVLIVVVLSFLFLMILELVVSLDGLVLLDGIG